MPATLASTKLSEFKPTLEELEQARKIREEADKGKRRSTETCLKQYLAKNPDLVASASSGELKEKCILNFMVLQLRSKQTTKTITTVQEVKQVAGKHLDKHWWNEWQMDQQLGEVVGKMWRESGIIKAKPCPITRSEEDAHKIWGVPVLWESLTEEDFKALRLETQGEGKAGDENLLANFSGLNQNTAQAIIDGKDPAKASEPAIKVESKTPEEILDEKMADIKKLQAPASANTTTCRLICRSWPARRSQTGSQTSLPTCSAKTSRASSKNQENPQGLREDVAGGD